MIDLLRWLMVAFSIAGAFLTPQIPAKCRLAGFTLWIISNGYLMASFYLAKDYPLFVMYVIYEIANILGVINNFKEMKKE